MKQKFIYMLSVAAALLATACTDDMGVQDIPVVAGKGQLVQVGANMNPASRMAIENDGEWMNYYWTADDEFTVFDAKHAQQTLFTIDADTLGSEVTSAIFTGTPETAYENGQTLYAVYNKNGKVIPDANGNVTLELSGQTGQLSDKYQYMFGETVYDADRKVEFNFRHLVTTLQVKIAVPEGVTTLSNVTLHSDNLVSKATLVMNKAPYDSENQFRVGDVVHSYSENGGNFEYGKITLDGTFTPEDGFVTLYIYALASKQYYDNVTWYDSPFISPTILFTDQDGGQHVSTDLLRQKQMEVGAVYSLEVNSTFELVDFANEAMVYGDQSSPYEIANADQLYTMMLRCYHRLENKNGILYLRRSYKLLDDIVLDNRTLWYPVELEHATFDGNGKTVSGEMVISVNGQTGFFKRLYRATLQNLTLDADITYETHNFGWSTIIGGLAAEIEYRSKILRCFNNSRVIIGDNVGGQFGGIVGDLGYRSIIENCGFSGSYISEKNYAYTVGGIAATNHSWGDDEPIQIIGCYSDGSFKFGHINGGANVGGIFGQMSGDPKAVVKYCWSSTSFTSVDETSVPNYGGIIGYVYQEEQTVASCYWSNTIANCFGVETELTSTNCASFEGTMPTPEQLKELNTGILASGLVFSEENGHLVKNNHTVVPPSDIENW